jgi:hypothetical protein
MFPKLFLFTKIIATSQVNVNITNLASANTFVMFKSQFISIIYRLHLGVHVIYTIGKFIFVLEMYF